MTRPRRGGPRTFARLWIGLLVAGLVAPLPARGQATDPVEITARLPVMRPKDANPNYAPNGQFIVNPTNRRGYQIFQLQSLNFGLQQFDLDTLKPLKYGTIPGQLITGNVSNAGISGEFLVSVDEENNRLFFPVNSGGIWAGVRVVDGETLKEVAFFDRGRAAPSPTDGGNLCASPNCVPTPPGLPAGTSVRYVHYSPALYTPAAKPVLLMLLQEAGAPGTERNSAIVWVSQWDAQTGKQDWIHRVTACQSNTLPAGANTKYGIALFQSHKGAGIYVACNASGGTGQVVRLLQDGSSRPTGELAYPGPTDVADATSDPDSDRMLMRVVNTEGESYWVFDGPSSSYVGIIGATVFSTATGSGVDTTTGRLYMLAPPTRQGRNRNEGGLMMSDIRRSPVAQATQFEQFAHIAQLRISVDPEATDRPRRVFVLPTGQNINEYWVFTDRLPISVDPPLADQDRFTVEAPEQPGMTGSNYTATGHGYGLRALLIGGLEGVPPQGPDVNGTRPGRYTPNSLGSGCGPSDREIVVGYVRQATLSNNLAAATAAATDADPGSKTDTKEPVGRCFPYPRPYIGGNYVDPPGTLENTARNAGLPYPAELGRYPKPPTELDKGTTTPAGPAPGVGQDWPYRTVECANQGNQNSGTHPAFPGYTSSVDCEQDKGQVVGSARTTNLDLGALRVGDVQTTVLLFRDAKRGLVARTESFIRGLEVRDPADPANPDKYLFRIDLVRNVAEAWAAGRYGTAGTNQMERTLCGIHAPTVGDPDNPGKKFHREACVLPTSGALAGVSGQVSPTFRNQPPVQFILNSALGSRGTVVIPDPDPELKQGSPGGYIASVQKDRLQQISAQSVNGDSSTQVPAVQITLFNDDPNLGRARQVYQLAGVDASSTYGIFLLNPVINEDGTIPDVPLPDLLADAFYGPLPPDGPVAAAPLNGAPTALGNQITRAAAKFGYGLSFLARRPREAALAAIVWLFLGLPVYFALRRRSLLTGVRLA